MSCETGINKFGGLVAARVGISRVGNKVGNVVGQLAGQVGQNATQTIERVARTSDRVTAAVGPRVAPVSNRLVGAVDRPTTVAANLTRLDHRSQLDPGTSLCHRAGPGPASGGGSDGRPAGG